MYVYKKKKKIKTTHMVAVVDVYDHWVRFFFMMMNARFLSFSSSRKQNTLLDCNKNQTTTELTGVETFGERNQFDERPLVFFFRLSFFFLKWFRLTVSTEIAAANAQPFSFSPGIFININRTRLCVITTPQNYSLINRVGNYLTTPEPHTHIPPEK